MSLSNPGEGIWDILDAALVNVKLCIEFGEDSSIDVSEKECTMFYILTIILHGSSGKFLLSQIL
jgi:hypothetical protein